MVRLALAGARRSRSTRADLRVSVVARGAGQVRLGTDALRAAAGTSTVGGKALKGLIELNVEEALGRE